MFRYSYEPEDHESEEVDKALTKILGDVLYRVILNPDFIVIIFKDEAESKNFMKSKVSNFVCDTSGIIRIGLSVVITDSVAIDSIEKVAYGKHKEKGR